MSLYCTNSGIFDILIKIADYNLQSYLYLPPTLGLTYWNFAKIFGSRKRSADINVWHYLRNDKFSCFDRTPTCVKRTDGRTDGRTVVQHIPR